MMERHLPDLYIEQLVLDELPKSRLDMVLSTPDLRNRVDSLKASNEEILDMYAPDEMAAAIRERLAGNTGDAPVIRKSTLWALLPAAVLAAALLIVLPAGMKRESADTGPAAELTRIKGAVPSLSIYKQVRGGSERLFEGSETSPRDLLQIGYVPAGKKYGAIISIDGRGKVTLHFPEHINDPKKLETGGETLLPFSYELDDAPRFERFYFVASDKDFSLPSVILSAESVAATREGFAMDRLPLPESFYQDSIVLMKE